MLVKLTYQDGRTRPGESNETQWGEGVSHTATGDPTQDLCTDGYIHCYEGLGVALVMNPKHANIPDPVAWECEGEIGKRDGWEKAGCRTLTTVRQVAYIPPPTDAFIIAIIYCALAVYDDPGFVDWAEGWLSGEDRSAAQAQAAAWAAAWAAARAAQAAAWAAARAAWAAEGGARAAAWADIIESALIWWIQLPL